MCRRLFTLCLALPLSFCMAAADDDAEHTSDSAVAELKGCAGAFAEFNASGSRLLTGSDTEVRVWDAVTFAPLSDAFGHGGRTIRAARLGLDGRHVVTAGDDGVARLWLATGGKPVRKFAHEDAVWSAAFSPDGRRVVTASLDGTAKIWDLDSGKPLHVLRHPSAVKYATFDAKDTHVLTHTAGKRMHVRIWEVATGWIVRTQVVDNPFTVEQERWLSPAALSHAGGKLAYVSFRWVHLRDGHADTIGMETFDHADGGAVVIRFSPDDEQLFTSTALGWAVWDATRENTVAFRGTGGPARDGQFSADGTRLLVSQLWRAALWDARAGTRLMTIGDRKAARVVSSSPAIALSPDGSHVAAGFLDTARTLIWRTPAAAAAPADPPG